MPNVPDALLQGAFATIAEGVVNRAPASVSDTMDVTSAGSFGDLLTQLPWGPERAGRLPHVGDLVWVAWPEVGDPFVVMWWPYG